MYIKCAKVRACVCERVHVYERGYVKMYNAHCFSVKWVQITCTRSKSKAHLFPFAVEFLVMLFDLHEPNGHVQVDALYDRERNLALSKKTVSGRSYVCCACLYDCFYLFY